MARVPARLDVTLGATELTAAQAAEAALAEGGPPSLSEAFRRLLGRIEGAAHARILTDATALAEAHARLAGCVTVRPFGRGPSR